METPIRDLAILCLIAGTGLRRGEVPGIRVSDVKFAGHNSGTVAIRLTKAGMRRVAFDGFTGRTLARYMQQYSLFDRPTAYLFNHSRREQEEQPLHPQSVYRVIKRAAARGGVLGTFEGAHDLRRLFMTTWNRKLKSMPDTLLLERQMGHCSGLRGRYDLSDADDIRERMVKTNVSPIAQIRLAEGE